jgi:hypothetical protein
MMEIIVLFISHNGYPALKYRAGSSYIIFSHLALSDNAHHIDYGRDRIYRQPLGRRCAALAKRRHSDALGQMRRTLKAKTMNSTRIDFERLLQKTPLPEKASANAGIQGGTPVNCLNKVIRP